MLPSNMHPPLGMEKEENKTIPNAIKSLLPCSRFRNLTGPWLSNSICRLVTVSRTNTFFCYSPTSKFLALSKDGFTRSLCKDTSMLLLSLPHLLGGGRAPPGTAPGTKPPYAHIHTPALTLHSAAHTHTHTSRTLTPPSTSPPCYLQLPRPCHPGRLAAPTPHMLPHALRFLVAPSVAFPQPAFSPLPCIDLLTHPPPDFLSHSSRSGLTFPFPSRTLIALPRLAKQGHTEQLVLAAFVYQQSSNVLLTCLAYPCLALAAQQFPCLALLALWSLAFLCTSMPCP